MLTGKTRYRKGWFGKVILQVEENITIDEDVGYGIGTHSSQCLQYRDARPNNILELYKLYTKDKKDAM